VNHMRSRATRWFLTLVAAVVPAFAFVLLQAAPATAIVCGLLPVEGQVINCRPTAQLIIDGVDVSGLLSITGGPKAFQIALNADVFIGIDPVDVAHVTLSTRTNADPSIDYALAFQNFLPTPHQFDYIVTQPFVGGPYTGLFTSHSGSVTDASRNGTIKVEVVPPGTFVHQPFVNGTKVDGLNSGCDLTTTPGGSTNCPPSGLETTVPILPTGETGTFGVEVHFTLSPLDIYTLNGHVELLPAQVPEPATLLLIAGGAVALAVRRRRAGTLIRD